MKTNPNSKVTFENMPSIMAELCNEVSNVKKELNELQKSFEPKKPTELMTRKEVAEFFKCDESTIHNWTEKHKLKKYCLSGRTYYKRSEVESALTTI